MSQDISRLKQKDVEGFQVEDGMDCSDKVVYAGGSFFLVGATAGALHAVYPRIWPSPLYGPTLKSAFYLMSKHAITCGMAAGAFALGACLTAKVLNQEGIGSCIVGGLMGGSMFAIRYRKTHSMGWTTAGMGFLIATGTSAYKLVYGHYLPDYPVDDRREFMFRKRMEARERDMKEITRQRIAAYENWRNQQ